MANRSYRYKDPVFSAYGKASPQKSTPPPSRRPSSFLQLKNLGIDDYILIFLMFLLIKDNKNPDWPLILSLGYVLFDFNDN